MDLCNAFKNNVYIYVTFGGFNLKVVTFSIKRNALKCNGPLKFFLNRRITVKNLT